VRDEIEQWFRDNQDKLNVGPASKPGQNKSDFKGPEGFSNVVGVGANPVIEAMTKQLEEQQKQTALLQNLVDRNPFMSSDFTKEPKIK
jgi:hypothetical protein